MKSDESVELTFEEALHELEEIVNALETGDVPLEKAITLFQDGMKLSHLCSQKLDKVEQQVEMLMEKNGEIVTSALDIEEEQ